MCSVNRHRGILERRSLNTVWWDGYRITKGIFCQPDPSSWEKKVGRGVGVVSVESGREGGLLLAVGRWVQVEGGS